MIREKGKKLFINLEKKAYNRMWKQLIWEMWRETTLWWYVEIKQESTYLMDMHLRGDGWQV